VRLQNQGERVQLDWIHNELYLGYTHYLGGAWGVSADTLSWLDHPWIGILNTEHSMPHEFTGSQ